MQDEVTSFVPASTGIWLVTPEHLCYPWGMDPLVKLKHMAQAACLESEANPMRSHANATRKSALALHPTRDREPDGISAQILCDGQMIPIQHVAGANGHRIPLLKSMLTTACEMDCLYCPFRSGRNQSRLNFQPHEIFHRMAKNGSVQGLFLSTGIIAGGARTQDRLLQTAEILRKKYHYDGYLHIKIMPGAEKDQVLHAMRLADRISINLEAPNAARLARIAPHKQFEEQLLQPFLWMQKLQTDLVPEDTWRKRWPSSATQFVVGAADETDVEILDTVAKLHTITGFRRAYFLAFRPMRDTPLDHLPAQDPRRQDRLYQAAFLLRDYGFDLEDLCFEQDGNLSLDRDPKLRYAQQTLQDTPLELNHAEQHQLLRVPGIGPRAAKAILQARKERTLNDLSQLHKMGILAERAAPYILLNGRRPAQQLSLFS